MKKSVSLVLTVVLLVALLTVFAMPAVAAEREIPSGTYQNITIDINETVKINSEVTLNGILQMNGISTLVIGSNGHLTGTDVAFLATASGKKIEIQDGGSLDLTFTMEDNAVRFADVLNNSVLSWNRNGKSVHAEAYVDADACDHIGSTATYKFTSVDQASKKYTNTITYCTHCHKILSIDNAPTASILSEGSLTIIVGVACSVVFLAVGFFLGRKKKTAFASGASSEDEE